MKITSTYGFEHCIIFGNTKYTFEDNVNKKIRHLAAKKTKNAYKLKNIWVFE